MLGALISSRVALMTYYSRPTLIQGLENTLGRPHGSIEPSFPLVEPGGHLGPPPKAKIALFARSPPKKNRKSPRVRSVHAEGALLFRWAPWLVGDVSFLLPAP